MKRNIDRTRRQIESIESIDQCFLDGDQQEAMLRTMTEQSGIEEIEDVVDEMPEVDIDGIKNVGFGFEVTIK